MGCKDRRRTEREVRGLTHDEERRLVAFCEGRALKAQTRGSWHGIRSHAMVQTFLGTGLRCSELAKLTCGDLQIGRGESAVIVRLGKGGKSRTVGIGPALKVLLRRFLDQKEGQGESVSFDAPLFASERTKKALHPSAIWRVVTGAYRSVGITCANVHSLRHTHARRLLASGADLAEVQHQLGHASLATTGIYLKPTLEERIEAVARMEQARHVNTQGKRTKVADRLARTRRNPLGSKRKLANCDGIRFQSIDH